MASNPRGVRPTRRCLADLGIIVPDLGLPLDEVDDPVVGAAQTVPERRDAGGAQRVLTLRDRVWFKVKTGDRRAVVTELAHRELAADYPGNIGAWWIGAAGHRRSDSPQEDFYASVARECRVGTTVSTVGLLPGAWDWKRLSAEQAIAWRREMKRIVVRLVASSLTSRTLAEAEFHQHRIKALVMGDSDNEAYLAIIAVGIPDPEVIALLLDCIPGISPQDWQAEPSQLVEMDASPGEIIWSTLFPAEVADAILAMVDE